MHVIHFYHGLSCFGRFIMGWYLIFLLSKDAFLRYRFSLLATDSHGTLTFTLELVGMYSAAASIRAVTKFFIRYSEYIFLMSPAENQTFF